ncbi:MAG: ATP-binding protein [Acidobacteriota bacterium]
MRKSSVVLLLVIQIFLVFFFENISSLAGALETREISHLKEKILLQAKYSILKYGENIDLLRSEKFFDEIFLMGAGENKEFEQVEEGNIIYFVDLKKGKKKTVRFRKRIESPSLMIIGKLKKFLSALVVLLGVFIIITGIYLVFLYKRRGSDIDKQNISLFQDYMVKLKDREVELNEIVKKQSFDVERSEKVNKSIINKINSAIILLNEKGRVEIFNPSAERIFSKSFAFARNNTLHVVFADFIEIANFVDQNKEKKISGEVDVKEKVFFVELIPLSSIGSMVIIRDITEQKKREEISTGRKNFEMLGEMAIFLTHEIRNSLGVIYGYTKTIKSESVKIKKINREIVFLTEMMENFLKFSKPVNPGDLEKIDLNKFITGLAGEIGIKINRSPREDVFILSDRNLLYSVFSNLLLNSKDANADKVEIKAEKGDHGEYRVFFKDNGDGIKDISGDKIWYPFYTSREKGTGMGLAIVKKVLNFLNGEIVLVSSDEKGTVFKIIFYKPDSADEV